MNSDKAIFITGATGLVGGLLALRALAAGYRLRLLVRSRGSLSAEERICQLFLLLAMPKEQWAEVRERISVIPGDVARPRFGLNAGDWQRAAENLQAVFHAAAYTGFEKSQAEISVSVNIDGTRNVLKFVELAGARYFHISTAYIVGDTQERIFEEPLHGAFRWKNPYEKTKFIAEQEVHAHCRQNALDYAVFRPSILIGDSQSGCTTGFNNIYNFMKVAHAISRRRRKEPVIIEAKASARLNIVPVDFAINSIWNLSQLTQCAGQVFHITNPSPPTFVQLVQAYTRILDLNIQCTDPHDSRNPGIILKGRRIGAAFSQYGDYMFGEPEFDLTRSRSLLPGYDDLFPSLNEAYYRRILDFAVSHKWGGRLQPVTTAQAAIHGANRGKSYTVRYFKEFLVDKLNKRLISNLKNLNAVVAVHFRDLQEPDWILELKDGMLVTISQNSRTPQCTYMTDTTTFEAVTRGNRRPEQIFFEGHGDIEGDIEKGLQVVTALSEFFRSFPFNPKMNSLGENSEP